MQMIEEQMWKIKDEKLKEKLRQAQTFLVQLKEKIIISIQQDQIEADALLASIANL